MASVQISGHSDDIISIGGAIRDEFSGDEQPRFVVLHPTRDVFRVQYGDPSKPSRGVWSVEHHVDTGKLTVRIERAPEGDDPEPYTDTAHVSGEIADARMWPHWPPREEDIAAIFDDAIDNGSLTEGEKAKCWIALHGEP